MSARVVDAMVDYINRNPGTSFVELERVATRHGVAAEGDHAIEVFRNGLLWGGVSEEFVALIKELRRRDEVEPRLLPPMVALMVYGTDGKMPRFPAAQRMPRDAAKGYARIRWIPLAFYAVGAAS